MHDVPKRIKRALRELSGLAYEVELGRALAALREQFTRWERGDQYTSGALNSAVAHAIATGAIERAKVAPEILDHLGSAMSFYESQESA